MTVRNGSCGANTPVRERLKPKKHMQDYIRRRK
jgi:hypothetical protein